MVPRIAVSHRSASRSSILRQFSGHFRGVPLAGAAHSAAISPKSRRVVMEESLSIIQPPEPGRRGWFENPHKLFRYH
jgi:hypothetical protein